MVLTFQNMEAYLAFLPEWTSSGFLKKVVPGQTLIAKSKLIPLRHSVARSECKIHSGDFLVADGVEYQ